MSRALGAFRGPRLAEGVLWDAAGGFPEDGVLGRNLKGGASWGGEKGFGLRPLAWERRPVPRLGGQAGGSGSPVPCWLTRAREPCPELSPLRTTGVAYQP